MEIFACCSLACFNQDHTASHCWYTMQVNLILPEQLLAFPNFGTLILWTYHYIHFSIIYITSKTFISIFCWFCSVLHPVHFSQYFNKKKKGQRRVNRRKSLLCSLKLSKINHKINHCKKWMMRWEYLCIHGIWEEQTSHKPSNCF